MSLSKDDIRKIIESIRENTAKLAACPGPHEFGEHAGAPGRTFKKCRCQKCGGELDSLHASWYKKGLEHGKGMQC